jgi:hypothetical protein
MSSGQRLPLQMARSKRDRGDVSGAAKTSFIMKCCEDSAVGKDGKSLAVPRRPAS